MLREETKRIWQVLLVAFTWGLFGIGIREQVIIPRLLQRLEASTLVYFDYLEKLPDWRK